MKAFALIAVAVLLCACGAGKTASNSPSPSNPASPVATFTTTPTSAQSPSPSCLAAQPSHRGGAAAAYDSGRQVTVLFGGVSVAPRTLDETWLFDGRCWQQAQTAVSPAPRVGAGMAYDAVVGRTLLVGGRSQLPGPADYPQDAWTWDGTAWTRLEGAPKFDFPLAAYDPARQVVMVFGFGPDGIPETWTWDGSVWARKLSSTSPSVNSLGAMCFDKATHSLLLYGGVSVSIAGGVSSETWLWDGSAWTQLQPAHIPGPRAEPVLLCGPSTVLFGGFADQSGKPTSGTWLWDGADWQKIAPVHTPPDCCGAAVYDGSNQMVFETAQDRIPIWSWNGSDWVQL